MALSDEEARALAQADVNGTLKFLTPSEIEQMQLQSQLLANQNPEQQPVEQQPVIEQPVNNVETNVTEQPAAPAAEPTNVEQPVVEQKVEVVTESPDSILEKISEGKIKNTAELKAVLERANVPQEEIAPVAKSINEAIKKGISIKDWAAQQLVDVDALPNAQLAEQYLMQTKGWTKEKAALYLENKFYTNEQYDDPSEAPREYKIAQIELEDLAAQAKQYFNSQKIDLDSFVASQPNVNELQSQLNQFYQAEQAKKQQNEKLAEYIDSSLQGFNSYSFNYNYTDTNAKEATAEVGLKLNEEQVKRGAEMLKDPQKLLDALTNGGKNMDVKSLVAKLNLITDDKLFSEMFADTHARSIEGYVKKLKNVSAPQIATVNPMTYNADEERQRIQEVLKNMPVVR